jgi:hypothetical protein
VGFGGHLRDAFPSIHYDHLRYEHDLLLNMPEYAPPPGPPPSNVQYAPPPGPPPPEPVVDDGPSTSEPPPPYTKNPTSSSQVLPLTTSSDIKFGRLSYFPPLPSGADGPLDPPPSCFSSPTPVRIRSRSFEPFCIPSRGSRLLDGFEPLYPPSLLGPHGISAEDWARFLRDVQLAANMAESGVSAVAPNRMGPPRALVKGILGGPRSARGGPYDQAFVKTPQEEVRS